MGVKKVTPKKKKSPEKNPPTQNMKTSKKKTPKKKVVPKKKSTSKKSPAKKKASPKKKVIPKKTPQKKKTSPKKKATPKRTSTKKKKATPKPSASKTTAKKKPTPKKIPAKKNGAFTKESVKKNDGPQILEEKKNQQSSPKASSVGTKRKRKSVTTESKVPQEPPSKKAKIDFQKWAVAANCHFSAPIDLDTFTNLVVPNTTKIYPKKFDEKTPVVVADIKDPGSVFGKTKCRGGNRYSTWNTKSCQMIFYPEQGKCDVWWTMDGY